MLSNNQAERKGLSRKEASDLKKFFKFSEELIKDIKGEFRAEAEDRDPQPERAVQLATQRRRLQEQALEVLDCVRKSWRRTEGSGSSSRASSGLKPRTEIHSLNEQHS